MTDINPTFVDTLEPFMRLLIFSIVVIGVGILEAIFPKRPITTNKSKRWLINFSLLFLNTGLVRIIFPLAAVGIAQYTQQQGWGLLTLFSLSNWSILILGFLILDFSIYWQHRLFHKVPLLWKIHKVHHSDINLDTSSGFRFHPIEILLSMLIKTIIIAALGIPIISVMIFEIVLSSAALFNHGNLRIAEKFDQYLRLFIVTPDMHRIHHSVNLDESNRNFGFNFPWWDKLFNSYQSQPNQGHQHMKIGLSEYFTYGNLSLMKLLAMPISGLKQKPPSKTGI